MPITDFVSWSLTDPDARWTADGTLMPLSDNRSYAVYGWRNDDEASARHVGFRLYDLDEFQSGEVLYEGPGGRLVTVSEVEFRSTACDP